MAVEKVLVYQHKVSKKKFYFLRLTSRLDSRGMRKVVVVGYEQHGTKLIELNPDVLLGEDSLWEYRGGQVYEG